MSKYCNVSASSRTVWSHLAIVSAAILIAAAPSLAIDLGALVNCMQGPGAEPLPTAPFTVDDCLNTFDADLDGDVDLRDAAVAMAVEGALCIDDTDCNDGLFCNGVELCVEGFCHRETAPCLIDYCDELLDICEESLCSGVDEPFQSGSRIGTLRGVDVDEASGLVASRMNPDVLWTHNDDTGDNRLFALALDGSMLGEYVVGTGANDPEDIAIGPGPLPDVDYLYWGDIGDNNNVRSSIRVKRVPEPLVSLGQEPLTVTLDDVEVITLRYPTDGTAPSHKDAETLLVDPLTADIYVVTKRTASSRVYRAVYPQSTTITNTMELVAALPWTGATGGDVSPDGSLILIRRYWGNDPTASVWERPVGTAFSDAFLDDDCSVPMQPEPQGEAICWDPDGQGYFTVSENPSIGGSVPIWYFARN